MRKRLMAAGAVACALVLAACGGSNGSAAGNSGGSGNSGSAGGGQQYAGKTLTVWWYETADSAMGKSWADAQKTFEAETGAKVKFELKTFNQIQSSGSMILNSDQAPDLMEYNKGNATAGKLATDGLLSDMGKYVKQYGWDKSLASSILTTAQYNDDGIMGSGTYYGIPSYGEYLMMYYNKDMFAKYNLKVPTTIDELETAMKTFKDHGITPLAESAQEYPLAQLWYQLALSKANRDWVNAYQTYTSNVDFTGPEISYATNTLQDWIQKGYISKSASGMKAQDATDAFQAGKYPMYFNGSWSWGSFVSEIKTFQWDAFLFPGSKMTLGSSGNLWVMPAKGGNKDLAAKFIDITLQKQAQDVMGNAGGLPVAADPSAITDPKSKELIENFDTVMKNDGLAFYPDWPTSSFYDQLNASMQDLLDGKSPADVEKTLGDQYKAGVQQMKEG